MSSTLTQECMENLEKDLKISFLVTKGKDDDPHITFINSLQAKNEREIIWAQNSQGESKTNLQINHEAAVLIMSLGLDLWRGRAVWTHSEIVGPEFDMYNNKPINRYNAYGAISKVHYMDVLEMGAKEKLNLPAAILGAIRTRILAPKAARKEEQERVMRPYAEKLVRQLQSLKFLAYIGDDGFPVIVPLIQAGAADSGRIIFSSKPNQNELLQIPTGAKVAIYAVSFSFDIVLLKGIFRGFQNKLGIVDIDRVYSPIPLKPGYVYPEPKLEAVIDF